MAPAGADVKLADQVEEPGGACFEVRGQLGDLVAEPIQVGDMLRRREDLWRLDVNGVPPFAGANLHPVFGGTRDPPEAAMADTLQFFGGTLSTRHSMIIDVDKKARRCIMSTHNPTTGIETIAGGTRGYDVVDRAPAADRPAIRPKTAPAINPAPPG